MLPPCLKVLPSVLEMLPYVTKYPLCFSLIYLSSYDSHSRLTVRIYLKFPKYAFHMIFSSAQTPFLYLSGLLFGYVKVELQHYFSEIFVSTYFSWVCCFLLISCYFVIIMVAPNQSVLGLLPPNDNNIHVVASAVFQKC